MKLLGCNKGRLIYLSVFIFFLLSTTSWAQPAFVSEGSQDIISGSFSIALESQQTYKKDHPIDIKAYVFNDTGLIVENGISCTINILDTESKLVLNSQMGHTNDYFNVTFTDTNLQGEHFYIVYCNNSEMGGFRTSELTISESGLPRNIEQTSLIIAMIAGILFFVIALIAKDIYLGYTSGFIFTIIGIYLFRFGYLGVNNFITDSSAIITVGVGIYILFRTAVEDLELSEQGGG